MLLLSSGGLRADRFSNHPCFSPAFTRPLQKGPFAFANYTF
jgi:hypothetical protein